MAKWYLTDINDEKKFIKDMKKSSDNISKCLTGKYKRKGSKK